MFLSSCKCQILNPVRNAAITMLITSNLMSYNSTSVHYYAAAVKSDLNFSSLPSDILKNIINQNERYHDVLKDGSKFHYDRVCSEDLKKLILRTTCRNIKSECDATKNTIGRLVIGRIIENNKYFTSDQELNDYVLRESNDPKIWDNKDFVLLLIKNLKDRVSENVTVLANVSSDSWLKEDLNVVNAAIMLNTDAIQYANLNTFDNDINGLSIVRRKPSALKYLPKCQKDEDVVVNAIDGLYHDDSGNFKSGMVLQYASDDLKDNEYIVEKAIEKSDGMALQFASEVLKGDFDIVSIAIEKSNGRALEFASEDLKNNVALVNVAVKLNGMALQYASNELKSNSNIVSNAIKYSKGLALQFASDELRKDPKTVKAAIQQSGMALQFASERLKNDHDVVELAVKQNGMALQFAQISENLNLNSRSDIRQKWKKIVRNSFDNHGEASALQFAFKYFRVPGDMRLYRELLFLTVKNIENRPQVFKELYYTTNMAFEDTANINVNETIIQDAMRMDEDLVRKYL